MSSETAPLVYTVPENPENRLEMVSASMSYPVATKTVNDPFGLPTSKVAEAHWTTRVRPFTPYEELVPAVPGLSKDQFRHLSRRSRLGVRIAHSVLNGEGIRKPEDEDRPKNIIEETQEWRASRKIGKALVKAAEASEIESQHTYIEERKDPNNPAVTRKVRVVNFRKNYDNLTTRQKHRANRDMRRYNNLKKQERRLTRGRRIPLTDKHIGGFEQIVDTPELRRLRENARS